MIQFHRETNNCFQDIIAMILENSNKNSLFMYQGSLNFGYNPQEKLWGNRIVPSRDGNCLDCTIYESLKDNFGFELYDRETTDIQTLLDEVDREENGIILEVDIYDCPWHKMGGRYHSMHYCWVVGYNKNEFICALPYGATRGFYKFENLLKYKKIRYWTFTLDLLTKEKSLDYIVDFAFRKCHDNGINIDIEQMIKMRNDIQREGINLADEKKGISDIYAIPIVRAIEWIVWSRINFRDLIESKNLNNIADQLIVCIQEAIDVWIGIKNYIIRAMIRENIILKEELEIFIDRVIQKEIMIQKELLLMRETICYVD